MVPSLIEAARQAPHAAKRSMTVLPGAALEFVQARKYRVVLLRKSARGVGTDWEEELRGWLPPCLGGWLVALHEACARLML